jgi:hypothetical protein
VQRLPEAIFQAGRRLFWDVDVGRLDPVRHEDFIFGRVLSEGTEEMVRALRAEVGDSALRAFLERAPHRLDRRTRRFLEVVLSDAATQEQTTCTKTPFRRNSDALFWR